MNRRPQTDFLNLGAHPMPPIPIDLRGDVRCTDAAAMDATTAAYAANDPLPVPPGMSDDDFDHEPCPPSSLTTQAMALRAGQKAMRETGIEVTDDDLRRYGLHPGDYLPAEPSEAYYTPSGLIEPVPGDSAIYSIFSPPATDKPLLTTTGPNGHVTVLTEAEQIEAKREAMGSAGVLALGVASAIMLAAIGGALWGYLDWVHTMASHIR